MPNTGLPDLFELIAHPELYIQNYPYHSYYKGVVVDTNDEERRGRVKVRVEEIWKSNPKTEFDQNPITPNSILPWAEVLIHGQNNKSGLFYVPPVGTWVIVAFEKGHYNFPIILGGWFARDEIPLAARGGTEGQGDTAGALKGKDGVTTPINTADGGTITEPANPYGAVYPNNTVLRTTSGHLIELDDTSSGERISIAHRSGTWVEFHPDGTLVFGIQNKRYTVVEQDDAEHIKGRQDVVVDGAATLATGSNYTQEITGDYTQDVLGKSKVEVDGRSTHKAASLNIESTSTMDIKATGNIIIGPGTSPGPIVTTITHPIDYITGIPILGVATVQAG